MVHGFKFFLLRTENSLDSVTYFRSTRAEQHFAAQVLHFISWGMNVEVYPVVVPFGAVGSWSQRVAKKANHVPKMSWFGKWTKCSLNALDRFRVLPREGFSRHHPPNKGSVDSMFRQIDDHDFVSRKSPPWQNYAEYKVNLDHAPRTRHLTSSIIRDTRVRNLSLPSKRFRPLLKTNQCVLPVADLVRVHFHSLSFDIL